MEEFKSLADLLDLQAVDLEIDRLLHQRQSLPELEKYKAAHAAAEEVRGEAQSKEAELRQTTLDLNKANGELEIGEQKLHEEENRLFAGGIGAREVEHLRQEVAMLRRKNGELEEHILELMERRESEEKELSVLTEQSTAADLEKVELEAIISEEWRKIDAEIAKKEARKADIAPLIPDDVMELYDELRESKEGVAVGRLAEGQCGGCHLKLTAAEQVQVVKNDPPRCLHCRRILVPQ